MNTPVLRVIVDFLPNEGQARVTGPLDQAPELCILALTTGIKAIAEKLHTERAAKIVVQHPGIIIPQ